jgi:KUP system potassium uptake protein
MSLTEPPSSPTAPAMPPPQRSGRHALAQPSGRQLWLLSLLALGIVYGDIGTSPLYAISECFGENGVPAARAGNVLGVLSLITWSLILAVSVKYLGFVLRADNRGEGGILALSALVAPTRGPRLRRVLTVIGLIGGAFLFSDGIITPAISILSAIEGLKVSQPGVGPYVMPITLVIIVLLFLFQSRGTAGVGAVFGPVTALYFTVIATLGVRSIAQDPAVLAAIDPGHALRFLADNGWQGYATIGSVFLVVTGGEALYADLGHFGRRPIRLAWFLVVLPALLMNYYGQGALLLRNPSVTNVYYQLAPAWMQLPLVALSAAAAVIASQAVISGVFSLTAQAIQLGYWPRMAITHTSATAIGQIYLPGVNWALMLACIGLVIGFGSSSNLAAAYGVAIAITMVVTTILFFFAARHVWRWPLAAALGLTGMFLLIDLTFLGSTLGKIANGGWFPLAVTAIIYVLMSTWHLGRGRLGQRLQAQALPLTTFLADAQTSRPARVAGTAVFMAGNPSATPSSLLHNLKHNKVLHERVIILNVLTRTAPYVADEDRSTVVDQGQGFISLTLRFGFKEDPDVPAALAAIPLGFAWKPMETSYFLGRETLRVSGSSGMARWRSRLFASMSSNALNAVAFFSLPANRVVELGMHVEI